MHIVAEIELRNRCFREAAKKEDKSVDNELPQDEADNADAPPVVVPEKTTRSPNGVYDFRDDRWVELY